MAADAVAARRKVAMLRRKVAAGSVTVASANRHLAQFHPGAGLILESTRIDRPSNRLAPPLTRRTFPPPGQGGPTDPYGPFPPGTGGGGRGFDPAGGFDQDFTGVACSLFEPGTLARRACEAAGGIIGGFLPGGDKTRPAGDGPCKNGQIKMGGKCVDPTAVLPGGDPFVTSAGGTAVAGSFGMPAIQPMVEQRTRRTCPSGMVLGKDNLCYPKAVLGRRSKFRKWKGAKRPPISVRDANAIRRAERAKSRVKRLAKDVGFSCKKR